MYGGLNSGQCIAENDSIIRIICEPLPTPLFHNLPRGGSVVSHALTNGLTSPLAQTFIAYERRESGRSAGQTRTPSTSCSSGAGLTCLMYRPSVSLRYQKV